MYRDGPTYNIHGNTYPIKDKLKALGGTWDGKKWSVVNTKENLDALRALGISLRVKAKRDAFCHESESIIYANSSDVQLGYTDKNFCGNCDSHYRDRVKLTRIDE